MAHYGSLGNFKLPVAADVRGATVYGLEDEKIGKLDDVILDNTGDVKYAVVDSGGWLKSHKFLVPADRIFPYAKSPGDFVVGVTKQQIKEFPPYDEKTLESQDDWKNYRDAYDQGWHDSPVQHHHGSDRNVTPAETAAAPSAGGPARDRDLTASELYPEPIHDKFSSPMPGGGKVTEHPGGTIDRAENAAYGADPLSSRWSAFQEHLRRNRVDIQASCPQCAPAPEKKRDVA